MASNYIITEVLNESDLFQVFSVWERNLSLSHKGSKEKYRWYYELNPYRKGRLWLLKMKDSNKAVGVAGLGFRNFRMGGRLLKGGLLADFAVDKKHRTLGPAIQLQKAVIEAAKNEVDFLYAFPNKPAEAVMKIAGHRKVGEFIRLVKVLKSGVYIDRIVKVRCLTKIISISIDFFLRLKLMKNLWITAKKFHSCKIDNLCSDYDKLWEQFAEECFLIGERTSRFLDWRYFKCPKGKYEILSIKDNDSVLRGFVIYYLFESQVQVVDLICPEYKENNILRSLILAFEKHCFSIHASSISISLLGAKKISNQLVSIGYRSREQSRCVMVFSGENKDLLSKLKDAEHSFWFLGDEDNN